MKEPGILEQIDVEEFRPRAPGPDEIQVEVSAAGLNFRDVLAAYGVYPDAVRAFGLECAGRIVATGESVADLQPGDRVAGLCLNGGFATVVTERAELFIRLDESLSFAESSTIPVTFLTAYYAMIYLARLQAGDRCLIHSAAGGVGLSAIQAAQNAGAEIYATVSTPEKIEYLKSLGVHQLSNSRSLEFESAVREQTNGEGVDLVLNSLAGEYIPANIRLLRNNGRYLEIGKKNILQYSEVFTLNSSISYFIIDLMKVAESMPNLIHALLLRLSKDFRAKRLKPLPFTSFEFCREGVIAAFRKMAQGRHIGKIIINMATLDAN